jgi:putative transposase
MDEIAGVSETQLCRQIVERLAATRRTAPLSRRLLRDAAAACGVAERTMWRWIARGSPPTRGGHGLVASERAVELLLQWRGNVAAVHRQLGEEGEPAPSRQTLGRAFERALSPVERDFARRGEPALRDRAVYLRHEARFRGECYEADHKQLSIEVLTPRAQRPRRPWVTMFIDQFSRLIVGWAISLRPTQAEVLAALRSRSTLRAASSAACRSCCGGIAGLSSPQTRSSRRRWRWGASRGARRRTRPEVGTPLPAGAVRQARAHRC